MATVEEPKPAVTTDAGVVEPTPAPAETLTTDKPAEATEPKVEEPAKTEAEPAAAVKEEKKIEPIYSGALGYKAPGLKNAFRYSKKYFWFGEEPVPVQSLSHYLRGEKAEVAHPTAAWSSQTGKGLLYFVKHADQKETPAGVLNLSEATDLGKDGIIAFHFKLHGHKHAFEGATKLERDGWYVAVEKAIEEAKESKETIVGSEGYKEEIGKLGKPAALAAAVAKESTPKKSTDAPKPAEAAEASASTEPTAAPARTGSSSSSSSDEEKKKKKKASKSKSRSVSRGKRASIFGGIFGNKEKEEKKEEKKEEEAEAKKEETPAPTAEASTVATTAPVITEDIPKVGEELKNETPIPAAEPATEAPKEETKAVEEKPKPTKRGSIFGSFVEKLKSPTTEKKEHEVVPPAVPAKEPETAAEAPKIEDPVAAPVADGTTEAPKEEKAEEAKPAPATTPAKEKQHFSFGKFLGSAKEKVKSPTAEKSPAEDAKIEEPAKTEEPSAPVAAAPVDSAAEAPKVEEKKEEETTAGVTTPATKPKRGSIFGNLTGSVKKEKDGEASDKPKGLSGLFRQASKAGKSKKEKEATPTPAKVEEETPAEAAKEVEKEETPAAAAAPTETKAIGDVVPEAVTVGQAPKSTPEVSATA